MVLGGALCFEGSDGGIVVTHFVTIVGLLLRRQSNLESRVVNQSAINYRISIAQAMPCSQKDGVVSTVDIRRGVEQPRIRVTRK